MVKQRKPFAWLGSNDLAQLLGDCAGDKEVRDRQLESQLPVEPCLGVKAAAGGAMTVAAGVSGRMLLSTLGAMPKLSASFWRTAASQIPQDTSMRRWHA